MICYSFKDWLIYLFNVFFHLSKVCVAYFGQKGPSFNGGSASVKSHHKEELMRYFIRFYITSECNS